MNSPNEIPVLWHTFSVDTAFAQLNSGPHGLSAAEVARRFAENGPNELEAVRPVSPVLELTK